MNILENLNIGWVSKSEAPPSSGEGPGSTAPTSGPGSKPRGGKYISREWSGDHWEYTYAEQPHQDQHGIQNAHTDSHSLEIPGHVSDQHHQAAQAGDQGAMKQIYQAARQHHEKPQTKIHPKTGKPVNVATRYDLKHPATGEPMQVVQGGSQLYAYNAKKDEEGNIVTDEEGKPVYNTEGSAARAPDWPGMINKLRQAGRIHEIKDESGKLQYLILPVKEKGKFNEETNKWESNNFKIKVLAGAPGFDDITGSASGGGKHVQGERKRKTKEGDEVTVAGWEKEKEPWKELVVKMPKNPAVAKDVAIAKANMLKRNFELLKERTNNQPASVHMSQGKSPNDILQNGLLPIENRPGRAIKSRLANAFTSPEEKGQFIQQLAKQNEQGIMQMLGTLEKRGVVVDYTDGMFTNPDHPVARALLYTAEKYDPKTMKMSVGDYLNNKISHIASMDAYKTKAPSKKADDSRQGAEETGYSSSGQAYDAANDVQDAMAAMIDDGMDEDDASDAVMATHDDDARVYRDALTAKLDLVSQHLPQYAGALHHLKQAANKITMPHNAGVPYTQRTDYNTSLKQLVDAGHLPNDPAWTNLLTVSPSEFHARVAATMSKSFSRGLRLASAANGTIFLKAVISIIFEDNLQKAEMAPPLTQYSHREGDEHNPRFYNKDGAGNYIRYTNAPDGHDDYLDHYGDPQVHPSEPTPDVAPQFFTPDGRKLTRAPSTGAQMQWNNNYHANDPKNLWAGRWVNPMSGQHEYTYIDADIRSQRNLQINRNNAIVDARMPMLRTYVVAMLKSNQLKDRVIGLMLALLDQGRFRVRELAGMRVGHVKIRKDIIMLGVRSFHADYKIQTELAYLTANRMPDEPLFMVPAVDAMGAVDFKKIRRIGPHLIMSILEELGIPLQALQTYHASQIYSVAIQNVFASNNVSWECAHHFALLEVAAEMGHDLDTVDDYEAACNAIQAAMIDPIVVETIKRNCAKLGIVSGTNQLTRPVFKTTPTVISTLSQRTNEETAFSSWIHIAPIHAFAEQRSLT